MMEILNPASNDRVFCLHAMDYMLKIYEWVDIAVSLTVIMTILLTRADKDRTGRENEILTDHLDNSFSVQHPGQCRKKKNN